MKKQLIALLAISCLSLSLVSCNKQDKFNDIDAFKDHLKTYENKVTLNEFQVFKEKLQESKSIHFREDYIKTEYNLSIKKGESLPKIEGYDNYDDNKEIAKYITKIDHDRYLLQYESIKDTIQEFKRMDTINKSKEHKIDESGYQEVDGKLVLANKIDKDYYNIPTTWDKMELNTYPQDEYLTFLLLENEEHYIDDNVYTIIINEETLLEKVQKIHQITIEETLLKFLKIENTKTLNNPDYLDIKASYTVVNYKDIDLKPYDLKDFKKKGLGE